MQQQRGKRINRVTNKPAADKGGGGELEQQQSDDTGGSEATGRDWRRASDGDRVSEITRLLAEGDDGEDDLTGAGDEPANGKNTNGDGDGDGAGDDVADDDESAAGDDGETHKKRAPKGLDDLAETLGVEPKDLYEVKVRTGTGKVRTLGELKDIAEDKDDLETQRVEFDEHRVSVENQLLRSRQDLDFVIQRLPKNSLSKEVLERADAERKRVIKVEGKRTLEAIPSWGDEEARENDLEGMGEFMQGYGFDAADIDRVVDHRMFKLLRDSWLRKVRADKALAKVKESGKDKSTGKRTSKAAAASESKATAGKKVDWSSPKKVTPFAFSKPK